MNKRSIFAVLLAVALILPLAAIDVWFSSAPGSAGHNASYYIEATAYNYNYWEPGDIYLLKNGYYVTGNGGYGYFSAGTWQADGGPQTIEYYAEAWDWSIYESAGAWHYITIDPPANSAPFGVRDYSHPIVSQYGNLYAAGWAVDNEMGAPVSQVDILIDGNYAGTASLGGYRPDVADAYGRSDFTYSGWGFNYNIGGLGVGTHSLELRAWDNQGASGNFGYTTFQVTNSSPSITLLSPAAQTITINTALTITSNATDPDGDITHHHLDIQRPDGTWNWQGGFANGEPYNGGPVGSGANSTRSAAFTFNIAGTWYVRSWVNDSASHNLHSATVAITVVVPNQAPTISWSTVPPVSPGVGTNFGARATGNDVDGNLTNVQVDISTNGGAWNPFAYNTGGNGYTNTSDANVVTAGAVGTTYQFRARAFDGGGLITAYIQTAVSTAVAVILPPTTVSSVATGSSFAAFSWSGASASGGIKQYNVYRNGTLVGSTTNTNFTDWTAVPGTAYSYTIKTVNNQDQESAASTTLNVTTTAASFMLFTPETP